MVGARYHSVRQGTGCGLERATENRVLVTATGGLGSGSLAEVSSGPGRGRRGGGRGGRRTSGDTPTRHGGGDTAGLL